MNTLQVHEPGLLTTVQDLGRGGFGPLGVSPSGAADHAALRLGNRTQRLGRVTEQHNPHHPFGIAH